MWALCFVLLAAANAKSIDDFGAVSDEGSVETAMSNSAAIMRAFAEADESNDDKTVEVPAGSTYYVMNASMSGLSDVTLLLDGKLVVHDNLTAWDPEDTHSFVLSFDDSTDLTITGDGKIDGQGWDWWTATLLSKRKHNARPTMIAMDSCENVLIENIKLKNSPRFNIKIEDMLNVTLRNLDIKVDVGKQTELVRAHGMDHPLTFDSGVEGLPMFPFNTDGIDPAGRDIHIYNCTIENYDDAVAVKPSSDKHTRPCTENVLVEDLQIKFGVGMSIGSISPSTHHNCIKDVTFRDVDFDTPFKGIYIKTNPGDEGTGEVTNVTYDGITMKNPVWYGVYIGPQQMKEPDGAGTGCMLYPLGGDEGCPTQPLVSITDITLRDVEISGGVFPGLLRCNETNPCTGWTFDNVKYTSELSKLEGYTCENVEGLDESHTSPKTGC